MTKPQFKSFALLAITSVAFLGFANAKCIAAPPLHTNTVEFPWCTDGSVTPKPASKPYRIINPMPAEPYRLEVMPPKQTYRYGWFGHNPTSHWTRHFGSSRNFTQWSLD